MTDQTFEDKVQKIAAEMRDAMRREDDGYPYAEFLSDMGDYIRDLEKICARARPLPTLADMTMEGRYACRWMQCDVRNAKITHGVIADNHGGNTHVLDAEGEVWYLPPADITPRPDLPRMTWPGDEKPAPAPAPALPGGWRVADHKNNGRVIVTTPNNDGRVYYVLPSDLDGLGFDWFFCHTDELTYLDGDN